MATRQDVEEKTVKQRSLAALDRSLSAAAFNSVGARIPRPALMLFEHAGNGLFWLPGVPCTAAAAA